MFAWFETRHRAVSCKAAMDVLCACDESRRAVSCNGVLMWCFFS